jgi:hypothetical protein
MVRLVVKLIQGIFVAALVSVGLICGIDTINNETIEISVSK